MVTAWPAESWETARARRLAALDDALNAVLSEDGEDLTPEERRALRAARDAVTDLRRTW